MKPRIALIAAVARNGVIGNAGRLPWHLRSDLQHFKKTTLHHAVIMGRKALGDAPRPLPDRLNIMLSRTAGNVPAGFAAARDIDHSLQLACDHAAAAGQDIIFVAGGADIYRQFLDKADLIYLSEIDLAPAGDTYFPAFDRSQFTEIKRENHAPATGDDAGYTFLVFERK